VRRDFTTLVKIEPILFETLNFFGTGTSQAVRLHGITEALSEDLKLNAKRNEESEVVDVPALLRVLEKHVLAEDSFTEKHVSYALRLLERLKAGLPVSALQHHNLNEVWDKLHALGLTDESTETPDYKALHEQNAIYQLMEQVGESPVGVREMLLAAWMHRLEEASDVLSYFNTLEEADLWQAWEAFYRSEEAIQQRFIKSIETAEVHQVLMGQSRRHFRVKAPSANGQTSLAQKQSVASKQPSFV
jgi:stress-induced morphogen